MSPEVQFRSSVSNDGTSLFPAETDRYVLYLHYGCPWAHRVNIILNIKSLNNIISTVVLDPTKTSEGWQFSGKMGTAHEDPLYGFSHIRQLYWKVDPDYKGPFSVPVLWDKKQEKIVNNESGEIMRMLYTKFDGLLPQDRREANAPGGGLYPPELRSKIDEMNAWIQEAINTGVYKCGTATAQETYDAQIKTLFSALDRVEDHLAQPGHGPYIFGDAITETDVRLYTSLIRFDVAYYSMLNCSLKMIRYDYPMLHDWLRRLYWDGSTMTNGGAFRRTTFFDHVSFDRCLHMLKSLPLTSCTDI